MYFEVIGKQVFATTGGKPFDNSKPTIMFLPGSALDHTFFQFILRASEGFLRLLSLGDLEF